MRISHVSASEVCVSPLCGPKNESGLDRLCVQDWPVVHNPLALAPNFRAPSAAGSPVLAMTSISCVIVQVCVHMLDFIVRVALPAAFERLPFPHPGPPHCWRFQSQHARPHTLTVNSPFRSSIVVCSYLCQDHTSGRQLHRASR